MTLRNTLVGSILLVHGADASWTSEKLRNTSWAGAGLCGLAAANLNNNEQGMQHFCDAGLDFRWNWGKTPQSEAYCAKTTFIPQFWGYGGNDDADSKAAGAFIGVMGYNEPDHYAPGCSAGTSDPYMACDSSVLASHWQTIVKGYRTANANGLVISPAVADAGANGLGTASAGDFTACLGRHQTSSDHLDDCDGWLKGFKESVMKLDCWDTNCWDAVDVIQFHAYFYNASDLITKVKLWEQVWADDLQGLNGRSKKSLWITEFARAGTTSADDSDGKAREYMTDAIAYLRASPYVSGWSWFSSQFASFEIDGVPPASPTWDSTLITKTGDVTALGTKYFELCAKAQPLTV